MDKQTRSKIPQHICVQLSALAQSFPSLCGLEGGDPFDPDALARQWLDQEGADTLARAARDNAIAFMLGPALSACSRDASSITLSTEAQNIARQWKLEAACSSWDRAHRDAFAAWVLALPYRHGDEGFISPVPPNPGAAPEPGAEKAGT